MINFLIKLWKNWMWITCDGCNEKMKDYTLQALVLTENGAKDRFYCKKCAHIFDKNKSNIKDIKKAIIKRINDTISIEELAWVLNTVGEVLIRRHMHEVTKH